MNELKFGSAQGESEHDTAGNRGKSEEQTQPYIKKKMKRKGNQVHDTLSEIEVELTMEPGDIADGHNFHLGKWGCKLVKLGLTNLDLYFKTCGFFYTMDCV